MIGRTKKFKLVPFKLGVEVQSVSHARRALEPCNTQSALPSATLLAFDFLRMTDWPIPAFMGQVLLATAHNFMR